jgi:hypothetical protein
MIGDVAYPNLTTSGCNTEHQEIRREVRSPQWVGGISSFGLNDWQTQALKGLFRLKKLPQNWDNEGSLPPSTQAIDSAFEILVSLPFEDLPSPFVSPTSNGGAQFEWTHNGRELEIEILPDGTLEFLTVINGTPLDEGPVKREQVPSLARWLRDETEQRSQTRGVLGWINNLVRT